MGQAEVKTDNGGLRLLDDLRHRRVERCAAWPVFRSCRVQGGFGVVTREFIEPSRLPLGIGPWVHVAKEIDVEWRMRSSSDCGDLIAELRGDNIAVGNEPRPPASETDTHSSTPCDPAIGAWMIGKREGRNSAVIPSPPSPLGPAVRSLCDLNGLRHTGDHRFRAQRRLQLPRCC